MDVAASVVGLTLAASTVYKALDNLVSACANAPDVAQEILAEIRDFEYALNRLRTRLSNRGEMTPLGAMATDATQLAVTLASCTLTFSQLERIVDGLTSKRVREPIVANRSEDLFATDIIEDLSAKRRGKQMSVYSRLRWAWENTNLTILIRRVQQHKTTLTLLLTIWISESSAEAEILVDSLNDLLNTLGTVTKAIPALATPPIIPADSEPSSAHTEQPPTHLGTSTDACCSDSTSVMSVGSRMSFTAILRKSRPYRDPAMLMPSSFSLSTSQRRGTQWSTFSISSNTSVFSLPFADFQLSDKPLAEESNVYRIIVPMKHDLLFNKSHYPDRSLLDTHGSTVLNNETDRCTNLSKLLKMDDLQILEAMIPDWRSNRIDVGGHYLSSMIAMNGGENLMRALLDCHIHSYIRLNDRNLLHRAVEGDNEVALRALLAAGFDRSERSAQDKTCSELALELRREKMIDILREHKKRLA
ncbi:hypothetical protein DFP73DRAFT_587552 [Morchella snyderi]|nr:hypothetical protein DFP73DRAFT_587552 [Morchella snyderi]